MTVQEAVQVLLDASGADRTEVTVYVAEDGTTRTVWDFRSYGVTFNDATHDYGSGTPDEFAAACEAFKGEQ